jgi:hypothetical protein
MTTLPWASTSFGAHQNHYGSHGELPSSAASGSRILVMLLHLPEPIAAYFLYGHVYLPL